MSFFSLFTGLAVRGRTGITNKSYRGARIEIPGKIQYKDRLVCADKFIVGIDPMKFKDALQKREVQDRIRELEERYRGVKVIIGVDRLDYIKGLTQKMKAFDMFLDDHPELHNQVVLIQVAVPSREDVKEYQELETELSTIAGKINGKHGILLLTLERIHEGLGCMLIDEMTATPNGTPLLYMHRSVPFDELTALYSVADVCLLTSTRDGMNLVSFEYVACQDKRNGILVLSEFAGAASFMKEGSITFHPANTTELSEAIYKATTMNDEERKKKHDTLREFINLNTRWVSSSLMVGLVADNVNAIVRNGARTSLKS